MKLISPAMHHYRCQNVYISTTASKRIVDTLEFFPHNYHMPQLSSTDRLLMAATDMTDALRNPHPDLLVWFVIADYFAVSDLSVFCDVFISMKKHVKVPGMSRMPWNRCPHSLPKPCVQSGWRRGSFMRAEYSISFPVLGG
jgi:hypothetical protein